MGKACIAFDEGRYKDALLYLKKCIRLNPNCPADVRVGMGHCFARLGRAEKARCCFVVYLWIHLAWKLIKGGVWTCLGTLSIQYPSCNCFGCSGPEHINARRCSKWDTVVRNGISEWARKSDGSQPLSESFLLQKCIFTDYCYKYNSLNIIRFRIWRRQNSSPFML